MSALKSGSSLRSLVLTPERIPSFFVPPRSPVFASPRLCRNSSDRTRLLSDHDDEASGACSASSPAASPRSLLRLPFSRVGRHHRAAAPEYVDVDLTTCVLTSLSDDPKGAIPRGFRSVLSTKLRESVFHHKKPVTVTVTDADAQDSVGKFPPGPGRSQVVLRPVKAVGRQMMKELARPAAALKSLSLSPRMTGP